ncbi:YqaA family protein [Halopenitus persicus]|uniref:Membrane protein YqaA, SNARE-associated domain n=1 Tax=Halopenitus persicus TaxID=1048396 RepID=A0A1H3JJP8_9EURY|nr:VTT domain-containing protein [Halopenitus persicus]SDY40097.1 membrane protein YqaA, SNARE-associated domain [Halopenitus persicus]
MVDLAPLLAISPPPSFSLSSLPLAEGAEALVESATGWPGLGIVFVYSFLIAFVLPGPSEVVLVAPIDLGGPAWGNLAGIMLVSAVGKAAGSVFAFHLGQEVKQSGPIVRWLRRSRWNVLAWSEKRSVQLAKRYGYGGLAIALSVPFFPDTISIYAFAVLEEDYVKFAIATFLGSLGRLLVTIGLFSGAAAVL